MVNMRQYTGDFLEDARAQIDLLTAALPRLGVDAAALADAHRAFHSLKSTAGTMGFATLSALAEKHESLLKTHIDSHTLPSQEQQTLVSTALQQVAQELLKIKE